eukprot:11613868-Prorocentrum_lima.AAC.1
MTSSLVGSEMCIRDRSMTANIPPSWGRERPEALSLLGMVQRYAHLGIAVSYTHLTLPTICSV